MNCPNCGNDVNDNQKFCSYCGYHLEDRQQDLSNNSKQSWIEKFLGIKLNYGLVLGALFLVIIFSALLLSVNKADNNNYTSNQQQNEQSENANPSNENESTEDEEMQEAKQSNPKRNCIYKTSNGVCFTTQVFAPEPIEEIDHNNKSNFSLNCTQNYWLGAKDTCECKGYRLPNDDELRSLFSDILGIYINGGIHIKTRKYSNSTVPNNYEILKLIAPKGFSGTGSWSNVDFWENEKFDDTRAYVRALTYYWGDQETELYFDSTNSINKNNSKAICVYNPNGYPRPSIRQQKAQEVKTMKQKFEQEKRAKEIQKQRQMDKEAENDLF